MVLIGSIHCNGRLVAGYGFLIRPLRIRRFGIYRDGRYCRRAPRDVDGYESFIDGPYYYSLDYRGRRVCHVLAPNNNAIMGSVPPAYFGMASSVISTVRLLGQVLSMAIVASILARNTGAAGTAIANVDKAVLLANIQYSFNGIYGLLCSRHYSVYDSE